MSSGVNRRIENFFAKDVSAFVEFLSDLDDRLGPDAVPKRDEVLASINDAYDRINAACSELEQSLANEADLLIQQTKERYRNEIAPWMDRSWFMLRAKTKPLGYAGDFEMLEGVYDAKPKANGIGGYLCLQGYQTTLARGVVARMNRALTFLLTEIKERAPDPVHILNVACGPCREFFEEEFKVAKEYDVKITLVDHEQKALDYVAKKVAAYGEENFPPITYRQHNALRMRSGEKNIEAFGGADILYSVGLCDYLPDKVLVPMLRGWRETLNPNGSMYVAFKDMLKYDKTVYQWMTDWYFLQRTTEECRELFLKAGFADDEVTMTRDAETESIITFCGHMPEAKAIRIDGAQQIQTPKSRATQKRQDIEW